MHRLALLCGSRYHLTTLRCQLLDFQQEEAQRLSWIPHSSAEKSGGDGSFSGFADDSLWSSCFVQLPGAEVLVVARIWQLARDLNKF